MPTIFGGAIYVPESTAPTPLTSRQTPGNTTRLIPMGGLEEIGKNMTAVEYNGDTVIIDAGLMFPDARYPGVDYLIPDVSYLEEKKETIRGLILTHGHLDHVGALPYIVERLGFPPLYGTALTLGMARKRLEEFALAEKCQYHVLSDATDSVQFGSIHISTFKLLHNIPGCLGLEIETPNGRIVYATDWKFDHTPADGELMDLHHLASLGKKGVDLFLSDSTGADKPGHTVSEKVVEESLDAVIRDVTGRLIIASISTNLNRVQQIFNIAARRGRKVQLCGFSLMQNVELAVSLHVLKLPENILLDDATARKTPHEKTIIITTGSQGEERSALVRMAQGNHRSVRITKGDTVMISASVIPGNERAVSHVKNALSRAGARVISSKYLDMDIHASGHAHQEDLKLMLALIRPKHFMPLHGEISHLRIHRALAEEVGIPADKILDSRNGSIVQLDGQGNATCINQYIPSTPILVDGLGVGDVGRQVLDERISLSKEGFLQVICAYDATTKKVIGSPDIISRGFIYLRDSMPLLNEIRVKIRDKVNQSADTVSQDAMRVEATKLVESFVVEKTGRKPSIIMTLIPISY